MTAAARRDKKVLTMMARGQSDDTISRAVGLTYGTIRVYNHKLYQRLGANNRAHAVAIFLTEELYVTENGLSKKPGRG